MTGPAKPKAPARRRGVVAGVERDIAKLPEELRESGVAATAIAMAEAIETGQGSRSECGKVLLDALDRLRALAPEEAAADGIDDLATARARRRRRSSTS